MVDGGVCTARVSRGICPRELHAKALSLRAVEQRRHRPCFACAPDSDCDRQAHRSGQDAADTRRDTGVPERADLVEVLQRRHAGTGGCRRRIASWALFWRRQQTRGGAGGQWFVSSREGRSPRCTPAHPLRVHARQREGLACGGRAGQGLEDSGSAVKGIRADAKALSCRRRHAGGGLRLA